MADPHSPTLAAMALAIHAGLTHKNDPEDSLLVSLTHRDLAHVTLGLWIISRLFPELVTEGLEGLLEKIQEVAGAQEFLLP